MSSNNWFPTAGKPPFINKLLTHQQFQEYIHQYDFGTVPPTKLVLHHTYEPTLEDWNGLKSMLGMQRHYAGLGWSAGPHIYAAPDGIWLATPMYDVGVHANACNGSVAEGWYSIGLEMVGRYDNVLPSGEVWKNALCVMDGFYTVRGLPITGLSLLLHRECNKQKSCPGWSVTKDWVMDEIMKYRDGKLTPNLSAWRLTEDATIRQGPSLFFPAVRLLALAEANLGPNVYFFDSIQNGYGHLAKLPPLQYDEGFVRLGAFERLDTVS